MDVERFSPGIVFVGRYRIPAGHTEAWRVANAEMTEFIAANLPDVLAFDAYLSDDGTEGTSIHVHRDAASFVRYLDAMASRIGRGTQIVEVQAIDLYGTPGDAVVERLRAMGPWPVRVHAHVNGFGFRSQP